MTMLKGTFKKLHQKYMHMCKHNKLNVHIDARNSIKTLQTVCI